MFSIMGDSDNGEELKKSKSWFLEIIVFEGFFNLVGFVIHLLELLVEMRVVVHVERHFEVVDLEYGRRFQI